MGAPELHWQAGGQVENYVCDRIASQLIFKAIQFQDAGTGSPVDSLSDRELEVLELLGRGFASREIAERLQ